MRGKGRAYRADRIYCFATVATVSHSPFMVGVILSTARKLALKIASYGVMHLVVAILTAFAITRDWRVALAVGLVEPIFQTLAYSIHDRVWHRIERRRLASQIEEATEAVTARLDIMSPGEQLRSHDAHHGHALPGSFKQIALKTITYGVMHFAVAVAVAYALTQDIRTALAIGMIEPLVQTAFFTLHDRIWTRIENRRVRRQPATA